MCLRSGGNRITICGEECTVSGFSLTYLSLGQQQEYATAQRKKKKDKFASLKPFQTWNFLPPCSVLVLDMDMASPASQLQQFGSSFTAVAPVPTWIMEGISSTTTGALGACCAHTGEGSWVSPRPKVPPAASQSLEPGPGNADSSPEAALAGPHDPHHPAQAPGQRTSRT